MARIIPYLTLLLCGCWMSCTSAKHEIDLSGTWTVILDSLDQGIGENWQDSLYADCITLPGTLCDAGLGIPCTLKPCMEKDVFLNLKRKFDYVGPAWFRKEVDVPADWEGKSVCLTLERVLWQSQVWVNGIKVEGACESLTTPHRYEVGHLLKPGGRNVLVLRIDNRQRYDISERLLAHAYTNETQTLWNGVLGHMTLEARPAVRLEELRLTPNADNGSVNVKVRLSGAIANGKIVFSVIDPAGKTLPEVSMPAGNTCLDFDYAIERPQLWDEFHPSLYQAVLTVEAGGERDMKRETFGMRRLAANDAILHINGRRLFLRGTLECCIFPLKGYPPTDEASWEKIFSTAHAYGLNHLRFHSWCPPEAAFRVADRMGFYLQVELPAWSLSIGEHPSTAAFMAAEASRISSEYGNHPSFCFWSLGNELQSDFRVLDSLLLKMKEQDPRHLYTATTFTFEPGHGDWPEPYDDFWISQWTHRGWVRGQGVFDDRPVSFDEDYSASIAGLPVPIVSHEVGQYSVYPNLKEIEKYTGNLLPLNFQAVQRDLEAKGRTGWAEENLKASGKLAVILYKEEIERALKTPGFSGFQLLDLHDFPGQGTALVGLLDAFWDSKGLISPEDFRRFCSPVVALARFAKATYTTDETLDVRFEVANFGAEPLQDVTPVWTLCDSKGSVLAQGELAEQDVALGNVQVIGQVSIPLSVTNKAEKLTLSISLKDMGYANSWSVWVYPVEVETAVSDVVYTRSFAEARTALAEGKKVLLNPAIEELNGLEGKFVQVFWSPVHFPNQAGSMGIYCDPAHPALSDFPTDAHSNWQWWDLCKRAKTLVMDSLDAGINPIVRMTDNFYKNRNLALVFEAKVGQGSLLMCSSDLDDSLDNRPVARQLRHSLLQYMATDAFSPQAKLSFDLIEQVFHNKERIVPQRKSIYD